MKTPSTPAPTFAKVEPHLLGDDQSLEEQTDLFKMLIDREVRRAAEQGPLGQAKIQEIAEIALDRQLGEDEMLALRAGLRERTIDVDDLVQSLQKRSTPALGRVLDDSIERNREIFAGRAEEYRQDQLRARTLNEQQRVIGYVNLASAQLPTRDRAKLEDALSDGRINPKTIQSLMERNQTAEIIDLAEDLEEERSLERSRARSIGGRS